MIEDDSIDVRCDWCFAARSFPSHYRHGGPDLCDGWHYVEHIPYPIAEACDDGVLLCSDACREECNSAVEQAQKRMVEDWKVARGLAVGARAVAKARAELSALDRCRVCHEQYCDAVDRQGDPIHQACGDAVRQ